MGDLIEPFVKTVFWLVMLAGHLSIQAARLTFLVLADVIKITAALVQQAGVKRP